MGRARDTFHALVLTDTSPPGMSASFHGLDTYVLQLVVLYLPTCPSWVVLATLSRRLYALVRNVKAFAVHFPRKGRYPRNVDTLLNEWAGTATLCSLDLSNLSYKESSSIFVVGGIVQTFPKHRMRALRRIVLNEVHRAELQVLFDLAPMLQSISVLNGERLSGTLKLNAGVSSSSSSATSRRSANLTSLSITNLAKARMSTVLPMVTYIGQHLKVLRFNGGPFIDSKVLSVLSTMDTPPKLKELSLAQCQGMQSFHVYNFLLRCASELEWLDLSFCSGMSGLPSPRMSLKDANGGLLPVPVLPRLQTLLLDNCRDLSTDFFLAIVNRAPILSMISLRGCSKLTASSFHHVLRTTSLTHLDFSHTKVTEECVSFATNVLVNLNYFGIEGCRSVSRVTRQKMYLQYKTKRRPAMYVHIDEEEDHRNAQVRYYRTPFVRQVNADAFVECEVGENDRGTHKRPRKKLKLKLKLNT